MDHVNLPMAIDGDAALKVLGVAGCAILLRSLYRKYTSPTKDIPGPPHPGWRKFLVGHFGMMRDAVRVLDRIEEVYWLTRILPSARRTRATQCRAGSRSTGQCSRSTA